MKVLGKRPIAVLLLTVASITPLFAMEIDSGLIRLILHEGIGRFSLYARANTASDQYIPLFVDRDPRTSGISLVVNDKIYKLGDSAEFSESAETSAGDALGRFQWSSRTLQIVQEFTPVRSSATGRTEGVRMSIEIRNRTLNRLSVGLRFLLDTYLGEANLSHFSTDRHQEIRNELTVTASDMVHYWLSPSAESPDEIGLRCITIGSDITPPDKIVFANWKRLSDASWDYRTSSNRNFNLMPYSINDSAVCMYYDPTDIPAMGSRKIVLVLANVTLTDYQGQAPAETGSVGATGAVSDEAAETVAEPPVEVAPEEAAEPPAAEAAEVVPGGVPEQTVEAAEVAGPEAAQATSLQQLLDSLSTESSSPEVNLDELDNFIDLIDERLAAAEPISEEELRLMEEILSVIKDKSEGYSGGR